MKPKHLAVIYLLILTIGTMISIYMPRTEPVDASAATVIPDEAIRLRILANSDEGKDQAVKRLIRDEVNEDITQWVKELTSIDEAREVIKSHLPDIQATAERVIKERGLDQTVHVDFGKAEFPTKLYGQYLYPAGDYEAVIITLGKGEGANWWCVLFPPLCFLDFSNGTAVSQSPIPDDGEEEGTDSDSANNKAYAAVSETEKAVDNLDSDLEEEDGSESVDLKETETEYGKQVVYKGEKEPEVEVKSFFAEIFHEIF